MGDYNGYKHGDTIEMGMGGERLTANRSAATSGASSANEFTKAGPMASNLDDNDDTDYKPVNWKKVLFTPKYLVLWIVLIIIGGLTAVISMKHDQVVDALRPFAEKVRDIPAGWLIFVAVLFIISFPPLFGHELVALLAGVVYGLWIGFGVVAAGTFVGEIGTWFAFKKVFRRKAEKMERTNLTYGAMAKLCRDGGFWIVFVIRLSIIPSHMSTAVFSTCDVRFWHFAVSTFVTLPKQLILVYLGVLLVGGKSDFWIKFGLFGVAGGVTVAAGIWIWYKMRSIKKELLAHQERRKAEKESRLMMGGGGVVGGSSLHPGAGGADAETMPLGRNNSYHTLPTDNQQQQQQQGYGYPSEMSGGYGQQQQYQQPQALDSRIASPKQEYQPYSPPQPAGPIGYAQTTPYPDDNAGDLGMYGRAEFPAPHDSPEHKKAVHPHGFV